MRYALAVPALLAAAWAYFQGPDEGMLQLQERLHLSALWPASLLNTTKHTIAVGYKGKGPVTLCRPGQGVKVRPHAVVKESKGAVTYWEGGKADIYLTPKGGKTFRATLGSGKEYRIVQDGEAYRVEMVAPPKPLGVTLP